VCAQQPLVLRVDKQADIAQAVPGDRVRFALTLVNEGPSALSGLVVRDVTPPGSTFLGAAAPRDWLITTPEQGATGEIIWRSANPLQPGESVQLDFLVALHPTTEGALLSSGCTVYADGWEQPLNGPDAAVQIVAPTATPVQVGPGPEPSAPTPAIGGVIAAVGAMIALRWLLRQKRV